jgi:hypothetical protein
MVNTEYTHILQEISDWHIVPQFPYSPAFHQRLKRLLGDTPYYADKGGNIVIGASSPSAVSGSGVCLRTELAGCGGVLKVGEGSKYLFSRVFGYYLPAKLLGRQFGVYSAINANKICELRVEWVDTESATPVLYFLASDRELKEISIAGTTIISHPAAFAVNNDILSGWNMSSLINSAIIIYLLKTRRPGNGFYGCLSLKALPQGCVPEGTDKLFFVNFAGFDDSVAKQNFGYRTEGLDVGGGRLFLSRTPGNYRCGQKIEVCGRIWELRIPPTPPQPTGLTPKRFLIPSWMNILNSLVHCPRL